MQYDGTQGVLPFRPVSVQVSVLIDRKSQVETKTTNDFTIKSFNELIKLCLPNNSIGLFDLDFNVDSKCSDEYILDVLIMVNDFNPDETSVKNMFEFLNKIILIRAYFKKMYFRCYRKVFAPDKRGFLRDIKEFKKINKEL